MKESTDIIRSRESTAVAAETDAAKAVAEVQARMGIAKRFPRDERSAIDRIVTACTRPRLAEQATYSYSRGGTDIYGPSIRLAEVIAQQWGNLDIGIRELEQREGESTVEAFAWDLETNTRKSVVFQVPHVRGKKTGRERLTDPRDIYETVANNGARRLRACILAIVPGDVVEEAMAQCDATLQANEDVTPKGIKVMLDTFGTYGVTKEMIEAKIQRKIEAITPALKANLRKIYVGLKDGMGTVEGYFGKSSIAQVRPLPTPTDESVAREEPSDTATSEVVRVVVSEIEKEGKKKDGTPWVLFKVTLDDGRVLTTFSSTIWETAVHAADHGVPVRITTSPGKKSGQLNCETMEAVLEEPDEEAPENDGSAQ